jgi:hypothetical protein
MSRILESEFRKELYKNLTEAGYDKKEAQAIVGKKYYEALKVDLVDRMKKQIANIESENSELVLSAEEYNNALTELEKLKEFAK